MITKTVAEKVRRGRTTTGITQKKLAEMVGKSESYIADIERGNTSPTMEVVEKIANSLGITIQELMGFEAPDTTYDEYSKLKIYNLEDRLTVAGILIKNGYTVGQTKQKKTETGKTLDYYLVARLTDENADTAR